jgi:endothelin-converting enzyme/putative endopeptidase
MKYLLSLVVLLALGCGEADEPYQAPAALDLAALDLSVDPCVDFYEFACGGWIKSNPIGAAGSHVSKYLEPYYASFPYLQEIIESDAAGERADDDPYAALIGDYYTSCLSAPHTISSRDTLRARLAEIDDVTTLEDLARKAAAQREIGSRAFCWLYVSPALGDATTYIAGLDQGGIKLADRAYYLEAEHEDVLALYEAHINIMSSLIGGAPIDAAAVIRVETALAEASLPAEDRRDPETLYHPMTAAEVAALAPTFPWQTFWDETGFSGLQKINVAVPGYFMALNDLLKTTSIEDLKSYLRWQLLQDHSRGLDQAFLDEDFAFWSTFTGQSAPPQRSVTCVSATLGELGFAVTRPYVARYFDEDAKETTAAIVDRVRAAFAKRLISAEWLDGPTRDEALAKLDALVANIGYPAEGPDLEGLVIAPGSYLDNAIELRRFSIARNRARLGQPVDRSEWSLSPLTVNAIYAWSANAITLPAIMLMPPFLDASRPSAANFGALGRVAGHEITHGFDDNGRKLDGTGTLRNWWTPAVEASFEERAQCVEEQFDAYEALPGEHVNGALTLGENIADLGGVTLAYEALFDGSEEESGSDGFDAAQTFFIAYTQTRCENIRPDLQSQRLFTDTHAPARLRINGPLSNLSAFREAFSCPANAPMVREEACEVW